MEAFNAILTIALRVLINWTHKVFIYLLFLRIGEGPNPNFFDKQETFIEIKQNYTILREGYKTLYRLIQNLT